MKKHHENFQIGLVQQADFKQFAAQVLLPDIMMPLQLTPLQLTPLHSHSISASFRSPADDYIEDHLDLNQLLINNKSAYGQQIRGRIQQWLSLPGCVGFAPTKTLAKQWKKTLETYAYSVIGKLLVRDVDLARIGQHLCVMKQLPSMLPAYVNKR
jgi:hypothetical protein